MNAVLRRLYHIKQSVLYRQHRQASPGLSPEGAPGAFSPNTPQDLVFSMTTFSSSIFLQPHQPLKIGPEIVSNCRLFASLQLVILIFVVFLKDLRSRRLVELPVRSQRSELDQVQRAVIDHQPSLRKARRHHTQPEDAVCTYSDCPRLL